MEETLGRGAPSPTDWREYRKFVPYLLGFFVFAISHNVAAATYFQLQQSGITVLVEGDKDTAKHVLQTTLRLQSAARWLLSWPDSYREPPVLVIDVNERVIHRAFKHSSKSTGSFTNQTTGTETWARTPSLVIVAVPMGYQRGHELRSLQHAYGEALLQGEPSHAWPACVQVGMSILFAAAELTAPNHFYLSGEKIRGSSDVWDPVRFLVPNDHLHDERMPQWELDAGGYSCYLLSFMIASAASDQRIAFARMLTAVGNGMPLATATTTELQQTLPEFTARYGVIGGSLHHNVRVDFPEEIPLMLEPSPISAEEVHALMDDLCNKLDNCRK
jgi:hypothetical protein